MAQLGGVAVQPASGGQDQSEFLYKGVSLTVNLGAATTIVLPVIGGACGCAAICSSLGLCHIVGVLTRRPRSTRLCRHRPPGRRAVYQQRQPRLPECVVARRALGRSKFD